MAKKGRAKMLARAIVKGLKQKQIPCKQYQ